LKNTASSTNTQKSDVHQTTENTRTTRIEYDAIFKQYSWFYNTTDLSSAIQSQLGGNTIKLHRNWYRDAYSSSILQDRNKRTNDPTDKINQSNKRQITDQQQPETKQSSKYRKIDRDVLTQHTFQQQQDAIKQYMAECEARPNPKRCSM